MFEKDYQIKFYALNMWANYIETGDVTLSAKDAINCGLPNKIQPLELEQQKLIIRLRELANKEMEIK